MAPPQDIIAAAEADIRDGRLADAVARLDGVEPPTVDSLRLKASAQRRLGRGVDALASIDAALAIRPDDVSSLNIRGNILRALQRPREALAAFDRLLALLPRNAVAYNNRGLALRDLERFSEALESFDRAVAFLPNDAESHYNRGSALADLKRPIEAIESFDRAIALKSDYAEAHSNRAVALRRMGRTDEALAGFERALAIRPTYTEALWNRSIGRLTLGQFEGGWRDYENRWKVAAFLTGSKSDMTAHLQGFLNPEVQVADLSGRSVLLVGEQGVGDILMFASTLPDLLASSARVSLTCDARLRRLLSHSFPGLDLLTAEQAAASAAHFDHVLGVGSLGRLFRNRPQDFPGRPYLSPRPEVVAHWGERLGPAHGRKRIGVSWRGGLARTGRNERSLDLDQLRPVLDLPGCDFVNLQYGVDAAEVAEVNARLERPIQVFDPAEIDDFEDLAALVLNLDLVVSVQTSLVHLSGAVGAPALVMVPANPEWRYAAAGSSMPWYSSVTLFRQGPDKDWTPVVERVAEAAAAQLRLGEASAAAAFAEGLRRHRAGDLPGAVDGYSQALAAAPDHFASLGNLATALRRLGRPQEALDHVERLVALRPTDAGAWHNRGNILRDSQRLDEALSSLERAAALDPRHVGAQASRGELLRQLGRPAEALAAFDLALAVTPADAGLHNQRGMALDDLGRPGEAVDAYDRALGLTPGFAAAHSNRGVALRKLNRLDEAIDSLDAALALKPDFADAQVNRAYARLALGQFAEGWVDYEQRWRVPAFVAESSSQMTAPLRGLLDPHLGLDGIRGRRLLVVGEQGPGDAMMFASILPDLIAVAAGVTLICDPRLRGLLAQSFPTVRVLDLAAAAARPPVFDHVLAIGSLGRLFRNRLEDFPAKAYLAPRDEVRQRWAVRLGPAEGRRRIGLSWRGGLPRTGAAARSLPIDALLPVLALPGCEFVSLQYGLQAGELDGRPIRAFAAEDIDDFEQLAGLAQNLDLIVSVQTSLVHLAGGLGAPVLAMVPYVPEWRYTAASPSMPWYGSVSLFRQGDDRDWTAVVRRVAEACVHRLGL